MTKIEIKNNICEGRKMEDGKQCKAQKASYCATYCVHHLDVIEVLTEMWLNILAETKIEYEYLLDKENYEYILTEFRNYVFGYIEWIMGVRSDHPWYYSENCEIRWTQLGKISRHRCHGRRLKDGKDCQNDISEESRGKRLCKECYFFERILHAGYKIAEDRISDKMEMDVFEDNKLITKQVEFGTRAYVEYCLRQEYEQITGMLSPFDNGSSAEGHRRRFRLYLGPKIFNHPYPSENLSTLDNNFILRYARFKEEAREMNDYWYDLWIKEDDERRKTRIINNYGKEWKPDENYEGHENVYYCNAEESNEMDYNNEESDEMDYNNEECDEMDNNNNYDDAHTQQSKIQLMPVDTYEYEDEKLFATTSAPRSEDWDRWYLWEHLKYKRMQVIVDNLEDNN